MNRQIVATKEIEAFGRHLREEERSEATVEKYMREMRQFQLFLAGQALDKARVASWKEHLLQKGNSPATVNGKLAALNAFLRFLGLESCKVKSLKVQRRLFRDAAKELTKEEYARLLSAARAAGRERLSLLMETICATGIRVSEVKYVTAEAVRAGRAEISLKGKIRTILLPGKLCRKLLKYAQRQKIVSGEVFLTRDGKPLSRKLIWAEMKALCQQAGVEPSKVFPHNLRHLFARCFYRATRDVARLADVLGHSSIETTRIYLISTGAEHIRALEQLRLVS